LVILVYAAVVFGQGDPSFNYFTQAVSGPGTFYGQYGGGGACTLDPTPDAGTNGIYMTLAVNTNDFRNSEICGACINITAIAPEAGGTTPVPSTFLAYANNECPSCNTGGIDFGITGNSIWQISWIVVPCPVSSNIQYFFQGSNPYYIKLQARNTVVPVYLISLQQNGAWVALARTPDNFFQANGGYNFPLVFPLQIQVESVLGDLVTDTIQALTNDVVINGNVQFPEQITGPGNTAASVSGNTAASVSGGTGTSATGSGTKTDSSSGTTGRSAACRPVFPAFLYALPLVAVFA